MVVVYLNVSLSKALRSKLCETKSKLSLELSKQGWKASLKKTRERGVKPLIIPLCAHRLLYIPYFMHLMGSVIAKLECLYSVPSLKMNTVRTQLRINEQIFIPFQFYSMLFQ